MPPEATLRVKGYTELQRAFALAEPALKKRLDDTLAEAGEPVRRDAASLALGEIRNITPSWAEMRVGVTRRSVYVAPQHRGTRLPRRKRRNLGNLLMGRAMEPALARNEHGTEAAVEDMLDRLSRDWERV